MSERFVDVGSVDNFIAEQENKATLQKSQRDVKLLQTFLGTRNELRIRGKHWKTGKNIGKHGETGENGEKHQNTGRIIVKHRKTRENRENQGKT